MLLASCLSLLCLVVSPALGDLPLLVNDAEYDSGGLGDYPTQLYNSSNVDSPRFNLAPHGDQRSSSGLYTCISPRGYSVNLRTPMIVDSRGRLVWASTAYQGRHMGTYNTQIQEYNGQQYLTFWVGDDHVKGHGQGYYFMLDSSYREFKKFTAGNGLLGDLHEFTITKDGTALITVYEAVEADLSMIPDAPRRGYIWDGLFQEIDLHTMKVMFQWRASHHYSLKDSLLPIQNRGAKGTPWDWFHINSIEKDDAGNFLISSRWLSTIAYVSGEDGKVLWNLGGPKNDFTDISSGKATHFNYQHHVRFRPDGTISLFDNGVDSNATEYSRGMRLALDTRKKTVELLTEYVHPLKVKSKSQGSMQYLPNGNVLIGWGSGAAAITEFDLNGTVVRDMHFGPAAGFGTAAVQSYRALQYPWTGAPLTQPDLAICGDAACVSWNGATEVAEWVLHDAASTGAGGEAEGGGRVAAVKTQGFETRLVFDEGQVERYVYAVAMDKEGVALGSTRTVEWRLESRLMNSERRIRRGAAIVLLVALISITGLVRIFYFECTWRKKAGGQYTKLPQDKK